MTDGMVGVIGAGVIGAGVAQSLAQAGHPVVLVDVSQPHLDRARDDIRAGMRMGRLLARRAGVSPAGDPIDRITFTCDYDALSSAWFVVENVTEHWDTKVEVHRRIDAICTSSCVVGANTSVIQIARLAAIGRHPERVVGVHFMNPVPLKKTVEVIRAPETSDAAVEATRVLLAGMGKDMLVVADSPGFVSNRVLMLTINEAACVLQDRVASAETIDGIFRRCCGHPMGPLETADLIGIDTVLLSIEGLQQSLGDAKFTPCSLLREMVAARRCGRKTGIGFYTYATPGE